MIIVKYDLVVMILSFIFFEVFIFLNVDFTIFSSLDNFNFF